VRFLRPRAIASIAVVLTGNLLALSAQSGRARSAVPVEPITAILDAFRSDSLVALGEGHHLSREDHAFRVSLIRDPRFPNIVNDIVVERGNARYQDVIDRFVRGEDVSADTLRHVWQDTTGLTFEFDAPLSEELFQAVRSVNARLPRERQLRVLLGDPPIEWESVRTFADMLRWGDQRDFFAADLIRREVLAKGRRALLIWGRGHFQRGNQRTNFESADWLAGLLESDGKTKLYSIFPVFASADARDEPDVSSVQRDIVSWPVPSLAHIAGTLLGAADFETYLPSDTRFVTQGERFVPLPRDQWRAMPMEQQFDAVLYLGRRLSLARLSPSTCADAAYIQMRSSRMALGPDGQANIARLEAHCAAVLGR